MSKKWGGGAGFEPAKAEPTDLQSVPFDRFGTPPTDFSCTGYLGRAGGGIRTHDLLFTKQLL